MASFIKTFLDLSFSTGKIIIIVTFYFCSLRMVREINDVFASLCMNEGLSELLISAGKGLVQTWGKEECELCKTF